MPPKPRIEDEIGTLLDGERLSRALAFIAYLKSNQINIQWTNANTWKAVKKGVSVCYIKAGVEKASGASCYPKLVDAGDAAKGSWVILPHINGLENQGVHNGMGYEELLSEEAALNTVLAKVRVCSDCGNTKKCAPGITLHFWGKELHNRCKFVAVPFLDPSADELECVKLLVEIYCRIKLG